MRSHKKIPGPGPLDLLLGLHPNPQAYCHRLMRRYGDVVRCKFWKDVFVINHPDLARQLLSEVHRKVDKQHFINERMKRVFGNGIIVSEGELWYQQRRILTPAFHSESVNRTAGIIEAATDSMLERWTSRAGATANLNLHQELHRLTFEIAEQVLFGVSRPELFDSLFKAMGQGADLISRSLPFNLPRWLPVPSEVRFQGVARRIDGLLRQIVRERRRSASSGSGDALSLLLAATDGDGRPLAEDQIIDEMKSLLIAGHYTTTDALTWTIYLLHRDGTPEDGWAGKPSEPELESAICEAMRLYSPVWSAWYRIREDLDLGEWRLPGSTVAMIDLFNIHRHPRYFRDPDGFVPSRFMPDNASFPPHAFMPFGFGPRKCIGATLAMKVMRTVLRRILAAVRIKVMNEGPVGTAVRVTLTQDRPILIRVEAQERP